MCDDLINFLKARRAEKDEQGHSIFTHTSLGEPKGSFFIKDEDKPELNRLIVKSLCNTEVRFRKPVFLSEKPMPVKILTGDIDLKYEIDISVRQHKSEHIQELLRIYAEAILMYMDLPANTDIDLWVFQRTGPYSDRGNMKDGIHIMLPTFRMHTDIQHLIRSYVLKHTDRWLKNPAFGVLPVKNTPDDIVDLSVIARNNWLMYGCTKPGRLPYLIEGVYRVQKTDTGFDLVRITPISDDPAFLINYLSTHRADQPEYELKSEHKAALEAQKEPKQKVLKLKPKAALAKPLKSTLEDEGKKNLSEDAKKLVKLLATWRADDYHAWMETGFCLYNINTGLKDTWIEFSQRSDKYRDGDCDRWDTFEKGNLNIGSLHRWARNDDPDGKKTTYNQVRSEMLQSILIQSLGGASQDVARVVYEMFKHQYVCVDAKGKKWAEFVNHSWKVTEEGISLKKKLGKEVLDEYISLISEYHTKTKETEDEDLRENYQQRAKALSDISYKLRDIVFKEKLMKEAVLLFHDSTFEDSLDRNPYLLGMSNGVYDLKTNTFRDGRPEDRVSLSTLIDYPEFEEDEIDITSEDSENVTVKAIFDFMKQVMPEPARRRYFWVTLASYLKGLNSDEKFHLWDGCGGNGKSKILELFEAAMGEYCFKLPINLLTQKRGQSGAATPELSLAGAKRFGSFQEPDEGAKINVGLLKELSGNDKLYTRKLYGEATIMTPMFSLVLLCNHIPKAPADDEGTWRRVVRMVFEACFVDKSANHVLGPNEFYKNVYLSQEFPNWAPYFFAILTQYYKIYASEGLVMPAIVKADTESYRRDCDAYAMFMDEYIEKSENGVLYLEDTYYAFKDWYTGEFNTKPPSRREFKPYMDKKLRQKYNTDGKTGWKGYTLKIMPERQTTEDEIFGTCLS